MVKRSMGLTTYVSNWVDYMLERNDNIVSTVLCFISYRKSMSVSPRWPLKTYSSFYSYFILAYWVQRMKFEYWSSDIRSGIIWMLKCYVILNNRIELKKKNFIYGTLWISQEWEKVGFSLFYKPISRGQPYIILTR